MSYFRPKCTKFDFGWGSAPHPLASLQHSLRPLVGFKKSTFKEGKGKGKDKRNETVGKGKRE